MLLLNILIGIWGCSNMEDIYKEYIVYGDTFILMKPTNPKRLFRDGLSSTKWKSGESISSIVKSSCFLGMMVGKIENLTFETRKM